jgi:hypothetical protein
MWLKLDFSHHKIPFIVFIIGSIFYLCIKAYIVLAPYVERSAPVEVDDAYVYMLEGEKLINCSFDTCPGFDTLEKQFMSDDKGEWGWGKLKAYQKVISVKFFSYGVILTGIATLLDVEIESVYYTTQFIGVVVGYIALALLLVYFSNFTIAGIVLMILSVDISEATTWMETFTPSNYSLILVVFFVMLFAKKPKSLSKIFYFPLFVLILFIHPVSVIYASAMIIMLTYDKSIKYAILRYRGEIVSILLVFIFYKLYVGIDVTSVDAGSLSIGGTILYNFDGVSSYFLNSFLNRELLFFLSFGIVYLFIKSHQYRVLIIRILLILMVSLLFYFHNAPAQLFFRLWDLIAPIAISLALIGLQDITKFKSTKCRGKIL